MRLRIAPAVLLAALALLTPATASAATSAPRFAGGGPAATGAHPAQASLQIDLLLGGSSLCAGTLVTATKVITAAHCLERDLLPGYVSAGSVRVFLGSDTFWAGTEHAVSALAVHPDYDSSTSSNDVAVLTLTTPSTQTPLPVLDPATQSAAYAPGTLATVIGWGNTSEGGSVSSTLQSVDVPIVSDTTCNEPASYNGTVNGPLMICAGLADGGKDACQGDSGGPLMVPVGGVLALVGVVSTGDGCARPDKYGIYTELPAPGIRSFLQAQIGTLPAPTSPPAPAPVAPAPSPTATPQPATAPAPAPAPAPPAPAPVVAPAPVPAPTTRPVVPTRITSISVRTLRGGLRVRGETSGTACRAGRVRVTTYRRGRLIRRTLRRPDSDCRVRSYLRGGGRLRVAIAFVPDEGRTSRLKTRTRVVR